MTAIERAREALEKARRLHHNDPADHNVGAFIDEALTWVEEVKKTDEALKGELQKLWIKVRALQDATRESGDDPRLTEKLAW